VDVLFRDLDVVERWLGDARRGRFEVLAQNGYIVGAPTYLLVGELAMGRPIMGEVPRPRLSGPARRDGARAVARASPCRADVRPGSCARG
jgi:hypothetical protein